MLKLLWFSTSLLIIFLILIDNPSGDIIKNLNAGNQFLNFRSNQIVIKQLIMFSIILFFILTILLSMQL